MDNKRIEKIILKVNANLSIEGMPLSTSDRKRIKDCLNGKITVNDSVKKLVEKHTIKRM